MSSCHLRQQIILQFNCDSATANELKVRNKQAQMKIWSRK